MPVPNKEAVREILYARLNTLVNSPDEDVSLKAIKELGTIAGIYAEVAPRQLTAQQTNNFTIPPDKLAEVVSGLRSIGSGQKPEPQPIKMEVVSDANV